MLQSNTFCSHPEKGKKEEKSLFKNEYFVQNYIEWGSGWKYKHYRKAVGRKLNLENVYMEIYGTILSTFI